MEIAKKHTCILVTFGRETRHVQELKRRGIFEEIIFIPWSDVQPSFKRHFRLSNLHFAKLSAPDHYQNVVALLKELVERYAIDLIISWAATLTEYVEPVDHIPKIADSCDCITLTQERHFRYMKPKMTALQRAAAHITLKRFKAFEKRLPQIHDYVVSISPVDQRRLMTLNESLQHRIVLIPNGIPEEVIENRSDIPEIENAIVFWGNLDYSPNHTAVVKFYKNVYEPYLTQKKVKWYIVGRNADSRLQRMVQEEENIVLTGFVENLYDLVTRIPVVINPMLIGSGMKNKVLEAFALGRLVISTALGMESVIGAEPGVHYVAAETPAEFSEAVLQYLSDPIARQRYGACARELVKQLYTWERIGEQWNQLIEIVLSSPRDGYPNHSV